MNTDTQLVVSVLALVGMILAIGMAIRSLFRRSVQPERRIEEETPSSRSLTEEAPRCFCGDLATEPRPELRRNRGTFDVLRKFYAAPPRYVRYVDKSSPPALCRIHSHSADAKMEEFLHVRVRGVFAEAYAKVALEAASFEKESLDKALNDSLTDREKKALRRPTTSNVISISANGTDGREIQS